MQHHAARHARHTDHAPQQQRRRACERRSVRLRLPRPRPVGVGCDGREHPVVPHGPHTRRGKKPSATTPHHIIRVSAVHRDGKAGTRRSHNKRGSRHRRRCRETYREPQRRDFPTHLPHPYGVERHTAQPHRLHHRRQRHAPSPAHRARTRLPHRHIRHSIVLRRLRASPPTLHPQPHEAAPQLAGNTLG